MTHSEITATTKSQKQVNLNLEFQSDRKTINMNNKICRNNSIVSRFKKSYCLYFIEVTKS